MIRSAIAGILALSVVSAAWGQQFPTVPDHTVIGRIGTGSSSGPSQAIPFTLFVPNIVGTQSANRIFSGPATGVAALPTWRALVGADLPLPAASTLGGVFSSTCSSSNWFRTLSTAGAFGCSQPAFTDITGVATGAQLPNPAAGTLGGVRSLAAVSHQFLTSISTAGQPTQAQPACADVSDASVYCSAARGQLPGETTTGSATAGNVGEFTSSVVLVGSAVSLSNGVDANVTSVSLTAGDWDIWGTVWTNPGGTTTSTFHKAWITTTSATAPTVPATGTANANIWTNTTAGGGNAIPVGPARITISGTTTVFLGATVTFAVSTMGAYGILRARRVR